ncbi:hypothetical protein Tco_1296812, partial [Tanacetum coccineum]
MDLKNKLKTSTKNQQAPIQNLEAKFDKLADKQSDRPSGSLLSNTQPNPKAVRINVPLVDVLAGMPNYGKFLKELVNNKNKIEQILAAFLSDESSDILQNKIPPKLGDPGSFLIPCNFNKAFSCNALSDLGASINLMSIDVIDEILEEDFDALLDEGSEILHSIEGTILEEKLFAEFDKFIAMTADENFESESDTEEP